MKAHLAMLPRLQAQEAQRASVVQAVPYMERRDRERLIESWQREASGGKTPQATPAHMADMSAIGIAVVRG